MTDTSPQNASDATQDPPKLEALRQTASDKHKAQWHSVKLELQTITPVYGGGTTAGEPDLLLPFRPRALKNSLRHWWWLLNRHKPEYKDKDDKNKDGSKRLYQDMTAIWGGASDKDEESQRAKVRVHVDALPLGSLGYVLWMTLQDDLKEIGKTLIKPGYKFTLHIDIHKSLEEQLPHLTSVVNAWLHLGGLGARTTRGLGKVQLNSITLTTEIAVKKFFSKDDEWFTSLKDAFTREPVINDKLSKESALDALELAVAAYRDFRQARQWGKIERGGRPPFFSRINRSYWAKADVIRFLTKKNHTHHKPHEKISNHLQPIPEMFFGAPINFKFKDKSSEPEKSYLSFHDKEKPLERFTSPLLVTVVRTSETQFHPAAFIFKHLSDIAAKRVYLAKPQKHIEFGTWWPDISKKENEQLASDLLAGLVRHEASPCQPTDSLRDAINASAVKNGNPLTAYLKFFQSWTSDKFKLPNQQK